MRGNFLYKKVGERILKARQSKKISQDHLAVISDIDRTYLAKIERGIANPTLKVLHKIAMNLHLKISKLLKGI